METRKKRIVSFDLDMTLLDHKTWKIPDSAMRTVEALRKDSVIVIGSGRDMNGAMSVMYREMVKPDAVIHLNGTRVEAEGEVIYEHFMDKERLQRLLGFAEENGISLGVTLEEKDYYTNPQGVIRMDELRWGSCDRHFEDPWKLLSLPVRTLVYLGGPEGVRELETHFPDMKFPMFSGLMGADVIEKEASKAEGLRRLCQYYGIPREQTIAFGDSMNDYEILCEAGLGIAMGNGVEKLKEAADYVTDPVDQDGIWNACCHFKLI